MVKFIAEVSSNHNKDLGRCLSFVDVAAEIGCDAMKFQLFRVNELFAPEILAKSKIHRDREAWELPCEFLPKLAERCQKVGIEFSCTPFYLEAVKELLPYVDFYKIASYELPWNDLLINCARTGKPVVLSTGMATMDEITQAVKIINENGCTDLTLLHCVSGYPTPVEQCNLAAIETLRKNFNLPVGWSDHSVSSGVVLRAVYRWKAKAVEFHLDLDGRGKEFSAGHCWLPKQIKWVIENTKSGEAADGDGLKIPTAAEMPDRLWRADPSDGLRPFVTVRKEWLG